MINKVTINPYDQIEYKSKTIKILQSKDQKDLIDYKFNFEITGSGIDRKLLFTSGYLKDDTQDNFYILDEDTIDKLINQLTIEKERLGKSNKAKVLLKELHSELNEYLDKGYIESITIEHKPNSLPPYFSKLLYKAFIIKPNFKYDTPKEINTEFNFLEVLHLDLNEGKFDETMNYLRNYHDIPIHFIGYDWYEEIKKRIKQAKKELRDYPDNKVGYSDDEKNKYNKMLNDLNMPFNVMNKK